MAYSLIAVDLQNDFTTKGGKAYEPRSSVAFLNQIFFPFLSKHKLKVNEIISDYRQPRPGDRGSNLCVPGTWGYKSIVPNSLVKSHWIKCMNSPVWVRENGGNSDKVPGLPYSDPKAFGKWLDENIGNSGKVIPLLFGLTIDCCVLSTLQELSWRGYRPQVLREGVDHYSGKIEDRDKVLESPVSNWAMVVGWEDIRGLLER